MWMNSRLNDHWLRLRWLYCSPSCLGYISFQTLPPAKNHIFTMKKIYFINQSFNVFFYILNCHFKAIVNSFLSIFFSFSLYLFSPSILCAWFKIEKKKKTVFTSHHTFNVILVKLTECWKWKKKNQIKKWSLVHRRRCRLASSVHPHLSDK